MEDVKVIGVEVIFPDQTVEHARFSLWEEDPETPEHVRLTLKLNEQEITSRAFDFFEALCEVRRVLERHGILVRCYGASLNVYPSAMIRDMGVAYVAYKLTLGEPARQSDLVCIFDSGPDVSPATIAEQETSYYQWLAALQPGLNSSL